MLSDPNSPTPTGDDELGPAADPFPFPGREDEALDYRKEQASFASGRDPEPVKNRNNGEEWELRDPKTGRPTFAANSTKGMPHDLKIGEVVGRPEQRGTAYEALLRAVNSQDPADFAAIPTGPNPTLTGPVEIKPSPTRPFVDPQNGVAFDLEGPDAPSAATYRGTLTPEPILFAPRFPDAELAADVGEIYVMALSRDVLVNRLHEGAPEDDFRVDDALDLMNRFSGYRGPRVKNDKGEFAVTRQTLFRGGNVLRQQGEGAGQSVGELSGPYLSQFLVIGSRLDNAFPPSLTTGTGDKREAGTSATGLPRLSRADGEVLYGTLTINQKQFEVQPDVDFVTDYDTWLQILQGVRPEDLANKNDRSSRYTGQRRFVYSLRQMAEYVHRDQTYQEGLIAALLILSMNEREARLIERARLANKPPPPPLFNPGNAYMDVPNQTGFGSFGNGHVLALLAEVNTRAIKAAWAQKWFNHRRLRPEVLGGRIHNTVTQTVKPSRYSLNADITGIDAGSGGDDGLGSDIMLRIAAHNALQNGANDRPTTASHLLPQQYPEGSPTHPSYPAGHATQIAAEVTVLKGLFNENFPITDPLGVADGDFALVPNNDGSALDIYEGSGSDESLTLGGELNKLAANVSLARSIAGVHYRLDYSESVLLGEYVGLGILQEQARQFNQARRGAVTKETFFFELTLFSGIKVRVLANGEIVQF